MDYYCAYKETVIELATSNFAFSDDLEHLNRLLIHTKILFQDIKAEEVNQLLEDLKATYNDLINASAAFIYI